MKTGLLFTLTTGGLSLCFLEISAQFMKELTGETFSYLFWFFIVWTVIGVMVFPFAVLIIRPLTIAPFWKSLIYLALGLVLLNFPFGAQDNKWITIEAIRDLLHPRPDSPPDFAQSVGVFHVMPLLAFGLSLFLFRDGLLYPLPEPPAESE